VVVASSWATIAWALASPGEPEPLALAEAEPLLPPEDGELVLLELPELHAASIAAVTIAPAPVSQRFHLCVIADFLHPSRIRQGCVNDSFLLRYIATVAKA
jgi:hypothetical protein